MYVERVHLIPCTTVLFSRVDKKIVLFIRLGSNSVLDDAPHSVHSEGFVCDIGYSD